MSHRQLTSEKLRRLQSAASPRGVFRILAIDHRGALLRMMDSHRDSQAAPERVTRLKLDIVRAVGTRATAIILDPQYSARQAIASGALPARVGLLTPLDGDVPNGIKTSSDGQRPAWSVNDAFRIGVSGVKLYLSYHPDAGQRTADQEEFVRSVVRQCAELAVPLFLEPVPSSIDPAAPVGSARFADERRRIVIRMVERLGALGPDVFKIPFPIDGQYEPDEAVWRTACSEVNDASPVPWTLLSAGDPFEIFARQFQIACEAGCSGFIAGRTLWSEVATADERNRGRLLDEVVVPRMEELNRIAERFGHRWQDKSPQKAIGQNSTAAN